MICFVFRARLFSLKIEVITNETVNNEQKAQTFETFSYESLENSENIFLGSSSDLDLHSFNTNIQNLNAPHILPKELQNQHFLGDDKGENISVLHLNIRSINKNFENFKLFYQIETLVSASFVFLKHG